MVIAIDIIGNVGTSGTITVVVKPNIPGIIITQPVQNLITNKALLTVKGTISGEVESPNLRVNGVSQTINVMDGTFSADVVLSEGINVIVVYGYGTGYASDVNYLSTTGVVLVILDTTTPVITLQSPIPDSVVSMAGCDVYGTVDDPYVNMATLTINGAPQTIQVCNGKFHQNMTLASGNNIVTVTVTDDASNTSSTSLAITYDKTKPDVKITSPVNGLVVNDANITLTGSISDTSIATATLFINGALQTLPVNSGSFSKNITLVKGVNTLEVKASDNAVPANTGTSGLVNVNLDNIAPRINIGLSDPADSITITVTSNEPLLVAPTVNVNSTFAVAMTQTDVNKWSGNYGSESSPIASGKYTMTANATDKAGNTTTRRATFCKQTVTITDNSTATVQTDTTTVQFNTTANITDAAVSVTQYLDNPSGNVGNPEGAENAAGVFVEVVASSELQNNLKQVYIKVNYDPAELPANTDESTLRLYLWDVASGTWQAVPDSGVNTTEHYIYGTVNHLSIYGGFGATIAPTPQPAPAPAPSSGGGGGGSGSSVVGEKRTTSIFSITTKMFKLGEDVEALSYDDKVKVFLKMGTEVKNAQGSFVTSIVIEKLTSPLSATTNAEIVGSVYDIGPSGATFDPPITITFSYDPNNLPEGVSEQDLALAWFDKTASEWKLLEDSVVDTSKRDVTAHISHFTPYAIIIHQKPTPPTPTPAPTVPSPAPVPSAPTPPYRHRHQHQYQHRPVSLCLTC